ncbi:MAG: general secretion pathway protein GspK [Pseudobdellovibrionaceae bacterium]
MIITFVVMEILYDTNVEYVINAKSLSRLKAYYAAKSGLEMSLLRLKIYQKVQSQLPKEVAGSQRKMVDLIWQFPFGWPPMIPPEASGVDKDMIKDKIKEATMDASYVTTISDEGSKIDLNDLASPSKTIQEITKKLLVQIFENLRINDEEWARAHEDLRPEEIVNNIIDWVDVDQISINGGDERQGYSEITSEKPLPPNRAFRTVEELRMVAGVTDEIYNLLKDRVTVYGMRAINPNYAPPEVLKALDSSINDEVLGKITARRNDPDKEPFKTASEFWGFVNSEGGRVSEENQKAIPLIFDQVSNFRIKSVGEFAGATREIEAVVFDFSSVGSAIAGQMNEESKKAAGGGGTSTSSSDQTKQNTNKSNQALPKGPPRIVYFIER